jgi:WD40 repeat protein
VTVSEDRSIKQFCLHQKILLKFTKNAHESEITTLRIHPKLPYIFTGSTDTRLKQWDLSEPLDNTSASSCNFEDVSLIYDYGANHKYPIGSIAATYNGKFIFTGGSDCNIVQYNIESKTIEQEYSKAHESSIKCLRVSRDDFYLFSGGDDQVLRQWDIEKKMLLRNYG